MHRVKRFISRHPIISGVLALLFTIIFTIIPAVMAYWDASTDKKMFPTLDAWFKKHEGLELLTIEPLELLWFSVPASLAMMAYIVYVVRSERTTPLELKHVLRVGPVMGGPAVRAAEVPAKQDHSQGEADRLAATGIDPAVVLARKEWGFFTFRLHLTRVRGEVADYEEEKIGGRMGFMRSGSYLLFDKHGLWSESAKHYLEHEEPMTFSVVRRIGQQPYRAKQMLLNNLDRIKEDLDRLESQFR